MQRGSISTTTTFISVLPPNRPGRRFGSTSASCPPRRKPRPSRLWPRREGTPRRSTSLRPAAISTTGLRDARGRACRALRVNATACGGGPTTGRHSQTTEQFPGTRSTFAKSRVRRRRMRTTRVRTLASRRRRRPRHRCRRRTRLRPSGARVPTSGARTRRRKPTAPRRRSTSFRRVPSSPTTRRRSTATPTARRASCGAALACTTPPTT